MGFFTDILGFLLKGIFYAIFSGVHAGVTAVIGHKPQKKTNRTKKKK